MGVLQLLARLNLMFGRKRGNDSLQLARYGEFCDKKKPPTPPRQDEGRWSPAWSQVDA